ncbi:MAG: HAMP domain-containing sensor histidine kinase [Caulobacteraceae bacterium]|nr:HAMP domain-containing sensor histidine kinase [Caulobacteraceae bacterium]
MIEALKDRLKRHWPALRLRTILLSVLLFAAAMPAVEAIWLRGYENTLVRRTEAELAAQAVALSATASALWPGAQPQPDTLTPRDPGYYHPEISTVDLSATPVLPERPAPHPASDAPDADAVAIAARMDPILDATSRTTLASIILLDRQGREVRGPSQGGDLSFLPEVRGALAGRPQTVLRRNGDYHPRYSMEWLSRASAIRLHHARPILVNGKVVGALLLSRSPRALFRNAYEDTWKMGAGAVLIIGLLIGLSGLVSRGVTRPIEALSAASHGVAAGKGDIPETPPTAAVEIRALYEDFRSMAEAINRRSRYLRDFAAAVSHEFKTPLAGIGGAVELLQDHLETMSPEERDRFLANIAADTNRLSQLVARLLDLARADMARPDADAEADLEACVRRIADAACAPGFTVTAALPPDLPAVAVPASTLEAVLGTLAQNSRQAQSRTMTITARAEGGVVLVSVADDGQGVPAADRERLFEPFFTTRRAVGGTGLGLAIARSLMEAHGGRIAMGAPTQGALFEITLPISAKAPDGLHEISTRP